MSSEGKEIIKRQLPPLPDVQPTQKSLPTDRFPYRLQVYPSVQFGFGEDSHLPWLQQLPDPTSSSMWGLPLEMDPGLAQQLLIVNGDTVRITSASGSIEAPVYVHPAAIPNVVSMAIGQGHTEYGRYASRRGANPLVLLGDSREEKTDIPALGSTFVTIKKLEHPSEFIQFTKIDRKIVPKRL